MNHVKEIHISKISDFSSASLSKYDRYLQIDLEPNHRKLIIGVKELGKLSRMHWTLVFADTIVLLNSLLERFIRRRRWLSRQYYELGCLINLFLNARAPADSGNTTPFELLQERIDRVLRYYKLRVLHRYRSLTVSSLVLPEGHIERVGELLYRELVDVSYRYEKRRRLSMLSRELVCVLIQTFRRKQRERGSQAE